MWLSAQGNSKRKFHIYVQKLCNISPVDRTFTLITTATTKSRVVSLTRFQIDFFFVLLLFSSLFIRGAQHSVWWQIIQKWKIDLDDHYLALRDQIHYCIWLIAGSAFKNITANMFEHTQNPFIQYNCMQLIARALLALCPFTTITEQQQQHE